jgi:hypothetical protein
MATVLETIQKSLLIESLIRRFIEDNEQEDVDENVMANSQSGASKTGSNKWASEVDTTSTAWGNQVSADEAAQEVTPTPSATRV